MCKLQYELTSVGTQPSAQTAFSMHHQNSSSVSPFHANTGVPASATAEATSFCNTTPAGEGTIQQSS